MPSALSVTWALKPNSTGLAEASLGDGPGVGVVERHDARRSVGDLAGEAGAGLGHDLLEDRDGALELGDEGGGLARGSRTGPAQRPAGVGGHDLGVFDARLGDGGQLAGQGQHLVFGLAAAPAQPRRDLMGASAHRTGAVPKARAPGQTERLQWPARSW